MMSQCAVRMHGHDLFNVKIIVKGHCMFVLNARSITFEMLAAFGND